jgi:hypothetical protein
MSFSAPEKRYLKLIDQSPQDLCNHFKTRLVLQRYTTILIKIVISHAGSKGLHRQQRTTKHLLVKLTDPPYLIQRN